MQLYPVKGAKFFIGAAMASIPNEDVDAADFTSVVWTQVKGWSNMGDITDTQAEITESVIDLGRDLSTKGTFNAPRQSHRFIPIADDVGQIAMRSASKTNYNYPMKVEWDDEPPTGSNPEPSKEMWIGLVFPGTRAGGAANTARMLAFDVKPNTNIVSVDATAGA